MANKENFTFEIQPITDNTDGIIPEKENVSDLGKQAILEISKIEWSYDISFSNSYHVGNKCCF